MTSKIRQIPLEQLKVVRSQRGKFFHIANPAKFEEGIVHPACNAGTNSHHQYPAIYQVCNGIVDCPKCLSMKYKLVKKEVKDSKGNAKLVRTSGFVYLIKSNEGVYKIGRTTNINKRLTQLQVASSVPLKVLWFKHFSNAPEVEKMLHETFKEYQYQGEWFKLPTSAIRWICGWGGSTS